MQTSAVRNGLTTLILHTTSLVYRKKEALKTAHAFSAIWLIISILCAEIFLNIISLPVYLAIRDTESDVATDPATASYHTRRVMTLTVISFLVILWGIKLAFILYLSFAGGEHYSVKEIPLHEQAIAGVTIDLPKTSLDTYLSAPTITETNGARGEITIMGKGTPNANIIITIEDSTRSATDHPRLYADMTDANGNFSISEDPSTFWLPDGSYVAHATIYDKVRGTRSVESNTLSFSVAPDFATSIFHHLDPILNILMLIFIVIAIVATVLTV